jgi:hypothetical protein
LRVFNPLPTAAGALATPEFLAVFTAISRPAEYWSGLGVCVIRVTVLPEMVIVAASCNRRFGGRAAVGSVPCTRAAMAAATFGFTPAVVLATAEVASLMAG